MARLCYTDGVATFPEDRGETGLKLTETGAQSGGIRAMPPRSGPLHRLGTGRHLYVTKGGPCSANL